jgi:hypothetical protein
MNMPGKKRPRSESFFFIYSDVQMDGQSAGQLTIFSFQADKQEGVSARE